jgi:hypothetical protein
MMAELRTGFSWFVTGIKEATGIFLHIYIWLVVSDLFHSIHSIHSPHSANRQPPNINMT